MKNSSYVWPLLLLLLSFDCRADLQTDDPKVVCPVLLDAQLRANAWTAGAEGSAQCRSPNRPIRDDQGHGNTIAFLADGVGDRVKRVLLIVDVEDRKAIDAPQRDLLRVTNSLSVRMLGLSIPHEIREAINKPKSVKVDVGTGSIQVYRTPTKDGKGVSILVVMQ
jgi:hypothetical protein